MNMLKRSLRTTFALAAGAAMLLGVSASAMADTTAGVVIATDPFTNVCSATVSTPNFALPNATWNGTTLSWNPVSASGSITGTIYATGPNGNRTCDVTVDNSDFVNTSSDVFLYKTALTIASYALPQTGQVTVPLSLAGASTTQTFSVSGTPIASAPAGSYTSTITITVADAP